MAGLAEILQENRRLRERLLEKEQRLKERDERLKERDERLKERDERLKERDERLREQDQVLAAHRETIAQRDAMLDALKASAEELAQQLELLKQKARGPASQRFVPDEQEPLPFPGDIAPPPRAPRAEPEAEPAPKGKRRGKKPRRRKRADVNHLKSREVRCAARPDALCAGCGGVLSVIGQAHSFRVDWVPGHFLVDDVVRDKCACPDCPDEGVLTVPGPYALDRALCGNSLLARVLVDKFCDHLPLHRQVKRMAREGFTVHSNTLARWVKQAAALMNVLAEAVRKELLSGRFLQGDDTGFPVQDLGNGSLRKGRLWAFTDQTQVFYGFTPTKEGVYPAKLLTGFVGDLLLVDGGSEFNQVIREQSLHRGGCWSHLRKYFFEARHHHPVEATLALGTIRDLFLLERTLFGEDPGTIRASRQAQAKPLIDGFFEWVKAMSLPTRPKSLLGKALTYARNQEAALRLHLGHGELPMHNNLSELMLRQAVVGRKNWLFARSQGGAEAAATLYTLIGSCMLQGIDPHEYLVDILNRLPDYPINRVSELTPTNWRLARQNHTAKVA